jgi:surface antigen
MHATPIILGLLLVAGCASDDSLGRYDPRLYDAYGNVVAAVPPPQPAPATGPECREVERTIIIGGQAERGYGTACRQPDGTWRFTN